MVASLTDQLSPGAVASTYRTLARILATAEIDGLIRRSPCIGVHLPRQTGHTEMHFLTPLEVARLAGTIEPRYHRLVFTAAYTGLRWGELAGLRRHRLDLDAGTVRVVEALSEVNGHVALGPTKTGAHRTVSLPPFLVEKLAEQLARTRRPTASSSPRPRAHHCDATSTAATSSLPSAASASLPDSASTT